MAGTRRAITAALISAACAALTACANAVETAPGGTSPATHQPVGTAAVASDGVSQATEPTRGAVVIVSIDGLRPDAIDRFGARSLQRLILEGAHSSAAQTIQPSRTLPSHVSMLTGVPPEVHGITWNDNQVGARGVVDVPTVFEVARERGLHTAAFFSKAKFRHLERAGSLDRAYGPTSNLEFWPATRTLPHAIAYLESRRPDLLFVHIAEPDFAGHTLGWMGRVYGWAVRRADGAVGKLLEAAERAYGEDGFTLIVTSDHGGHGRAHASEDPRNTTIPWIAWGRGVRAGSISAPIRTMDTAATALWLLGVPVPEEWAGRPVTTAFLPAVPLGY